MIVFGILNLTTDSFSDGNEATDPESAIEKAKDLLSQGADVLDLGAQASHPEAQAKTWQEEWSALEPILDNPAIPNRIVSIDSFRTEVQELSLGKGVGYLNDISGFGSPMAPSLFKGLKADRCPNLVVMHSHTGGIASLQESPYTVQNVIGEVLKFLSDRKAQLLSWGIPEKKLIFDPGMGFFLGKDPELSWEVLRNWRTFRERLGPTLLSVSRKSFLTSILGPEPPKKRDFATKILELLLYEQGVDFLRTHDVKGTKEAIAIQNKLLPALSDTGSQSF